MLPFFFLGCLLYCPPTDFAAPLAVSAVTLVFLASLTTQQLVWFGRLPLTGVQTNLLRLCEGSIFTFLIFRFRWANPRLAMLRGFACRSSRSMCSAPPAPACWQRVRYRQPPHPARARYCLRALATDRGRPDLPAGRGPAAGLPGTSLSRVVA
jgi:hypothetical protein